ncbi:MAG: hypothetical protein HY400_02110, partial [Elusimicrobia bacterium]|nr:hypothetical protein [Elusimicrobiota bacterium]
GVFIHFDYITPPLESFSRLTQIVTTDAPLPMTVVKKGKFKLEVKPTYFSVSQLADTSYLLSSGGIYSGGNLNGWGGAAALSYAVSDEPWLLYGIFSGASVRGRSRAKLIPAFQQPMVDAFDMEGRSSIYVLNTGVGWDIVQGMMDGFSSIATFGLLTQFYSTDMDVLPLSGSYDRLKVRGSGVLPGFSFGIVCDADIGEYFRMTPYLMFGGTFSEPESEVEVLQSGNHPAGTKESGPSGSRLFPMLGVNLTYRPWGLSVSLSGFLTSYYSRLFDGLKVTQFSFSKSFGGY